MTYRIKRIKEEFGGFEATPIDPRVSQWNAERDAHTNASHLEAKAFPPKKVKIRDDTHPRPHEVYNCTTCTRGRELPANKITKEDYHYRCTWDLKEHIGEGMKKNLGDNGCPNWDRKIPIPYHGYMPGVEL